MLYRYPRMLNCNVYEITLTNIERFYNIFQHFAMLQFSISEMLIQYYRNIVYVFQNL